MKPETSPATALLAKMIGCNSVGATISGRPDAERPLAELLEQQAQAFGLTTRRLPVDGRGFNLLVTHETEADRPWLLFESHLDTVGVEGMTIDPFAAVIRDGRIHGRGACDTKGTGAAMLWALKTYAAADARPHNVALLFSIDEEIAKTGIRTFVRDHLPGLGWKPIAAVVGEPTGLRPVVAHKGVVRWPIRTHGRAAHSSEPSRGRSAISMMLKVVDALESRYIPGLTAAHPLVGRAACSVNLIRGGTLINIIPAECEVQVDRRIVPGVPGEDGAGVLAEVQAVLDELCAADAQLRVSQGEPFVDPPLDPADSVWFAEHVGDVLQKQGLTGEPEGVGYGTDASDLGAAGIPTIVLGPGDIAQAHSADEWLELEQFEQAIAVYLDLMRTPMGG